MKQKKEREILQTICPISFETSRADGSWRMGEQVDERQLRNNNYTYYMPATGSDILRNCQEKIGYQIMKSQIELEEQHNRLEQRYDFEKRLAGLKINYRIYLELMASTVYRDSAGNIVYAISDEGGKTIASKILLNIRGYRSKMYISYYPKTQSVFEIAWGEDDRNKILFECTKDGISPREFLKRLKSRGGYYLCLVKQSQRRHKRYFLIHFFQLRNVKSHLTLVGAWIRRGNGTLQEKAR